MESSIAGRALNVKVSDRQILSIALPIAVSILIPQLNLLINSIFLGHLSQNALGNAGVTGVFYLIFAVAGHGLNNAMQSLLSGYAGSGKTERFHTVISQGLGISLILSVFFIVFTHFFAPFILQSNQDPKNLITELEFLNIRMLGLPFLYLFQLGNAFLISTLNSRWLIIGFIMQAGFNIFFDYVLIFGNWGFPEMGFNGAALASVLAECVGMLSVLGVITFTGLKSKYQLFQTLNFNWEATRKIIVVAFPLVLQYIISLATWFVFFLLIEEKGDLAKAVSNTMRNVFGMAGVFIWAFSGTSNAMVSNIIGQRKLYKVKPAIQRISLWSFGFCALMVLLLNLFPNAFFALFGQSDSFNALSKDVLFVVSAGMLVMSVSNIWLNGLTGTGKTKVNLIIEITAISFYLIHTYFFMKLQYVSLAIAWSNELVYWGTILLFSYLYMRSQNWKKGANSR